MRMKPLLAGALLWAAMMPAAQAVIISATGNALDNGLIFIDEPDLNEVNVVKVFTAPERSLFCHILILAGMSKVYLLPAIAGATFCSLIGRRSVSPIIAPA